MTDLKAYTEARERVASMARDADRLEGLSALVRVSDLSLLLSGPPVTAWGAQTVEPAHPVGDQEFLTRLKQLQLRLVFEQKTSDAITVAMALSRLTAAAALSALQTKEPKP